MVEIRQIWKENLLKNLLHLVQKNLKKIKIQTNKMAPKLVNLNPVAPGTQVNLELELMAILYRNEQEQEQMAVLYRKSQKLI